MKGFDLHIRWMIRRDMSDVLAIENESHSPAWEEADFLRCLRQRNCIGMVAERGSGIAGFMAYELHPGKLHLLRLAVAANERLQGVGERMIAKLVAKLKSHNRTRITFAAHERMDGGLMFLRSCGFIAVKTLREWFDDGDGVLMRYDLNKSSPLAAASPDLGGESGGA